MFSVSVPSCHKHKIRPAADFAIKPMPGFLRIICIFLVIIFCQYVSSTDLDVVLQRTVEELLANTVVDETAIRYACCVNANEIFQSFAAAGFLPFRV